MNTKIIICFIVSYFLIRIYQIIQLLKPTKESLNKSEADNPVETPEIKNPNESIIKTNELTELIETNTQPNKPAETTQLNTKSTEQIQKNTVKTEPNEPNELTEPNESNESNELTEPNESTKSTELIYPIKPSAKELTELNIKSVSNKEIPVSSDIHNYTKDCSKNLIIILKNKIHNPLLKQIEEIFKIKTVQNVLNCLNNESSCNRDLEIDSREQLNSDSLKLSSLFLDKWSSTSDFENKKKIIKPFINEISTQLNLNNNIDILTDIIIHYFNSVYKIISEYNKKVSVIVTEDRSLIQSHFDKCKNKSGDINYCYYIFNYIANLYLPSKNNKLIETLNKTEISFNKLVKPNSKCSLVSEINQTPLTDDILKIIKNASNYKNGDPDIQTVQSDRLAKLTLHSNTRQNTENLSDLSLKTIIHNTFQTALEVINEFPMITNINDLIIILNKNNRLFYIGIILIIISIIMFAVKN